MGHREFLKFFVEKGVRESEVRTRKGDLQLLKCARERGCSWNQNVYSKEGRRWTGCGGRGRREEGGERR
jgi:hypothetical protein